ncbi:MAG TPA: hypothetical protein VK186_10275 [Candidatus Deferrimicrobium sp.]|nr:hypothetical protein [Candidatus Kapabacteria bacterium]HLP59207.1 hypothetical protein [Candidatus Deferrimicrobium sp.]
MNTISIWYKKKVDCTENEFEKVSLDLHFNFWKLKEKWSFKANKVKRKWPFTTDYAYFLDIGLKIKDFKFIDTVKLYFPFELKKDAIKDLGNFVVNDTSLVNAIFNEEYKIISIPNKKFSDLEHPDNKRNFSIYCIDTNNDLVIEKKHNGSIVTLNVGTINCGNKECYFRFRISSEFLRQFTHLYTPKNSLFQSAFIETEVIDLRLNEKRNLDQNLLEEMEREKMFKINKIHFLLLRNAEDNFVFAHHDTNTCRVLEEKIWDKYIDFKHKEKKIIAYHWKKTDDNHSFNAFVKIEFKRNNITTIIMYVLIILILSVTFNLLSSFLFDWIKQQNHDAIPSNITYKDSKNG